MGLRWIWLRAVGLAAAFGVALLWAGALEAQDQASDKPAGAVEQAVKDGRRLGKIKNQELNEPTMVVKLDIKSSLPHDQSSYTQGLFFYQGCLFESRGLYGRSALSKYEFGLSQAPSLLQNYILGDEYFAEGAVEAGGEIYLLTWLEGTVFVLDPQSLKLKRRASYQGEGWGLAYDGQRLWRSDGSERLYPHRVGDFAPAGRPLIVRDGRRPLTGLNELEWDPRSGLMLANVYGLDLVAVIDMSSGRLRCWLDARPLRALAEAEAIWAPQGHDYDVVLNGLALGPGGLWLTGKLWPRLFQAFWPPAELLSSGELKK